MRSYTEHSVFSSLFRVFATISCSSLSCPRRPAGEHPVIHRAIRPMRPGEVPQAHQELADDLPTGEAEGLLEELDPLRLGQRMVRVEPLGEGAVRFTEGEHHPRVVDRRLDLEPVPDDPGITHEPRLVAGGEAGDDGRV